MRFGLVAMMLAFGAVLGANESAQAQMPPLVTVDNALVCSTYRAVPQAYQARDKGDSAWLKDLDCTTVKGGLKVTVLDTYSGLYVWQMRVHLPEGRGATVVARPCELRVEGQPAPLDCLHNGKFSAPPPSAVR